MFEELMSLAVFDSDRLYWFSWEMCSYNKSSYSSTEPFGSDSENFVHQ